MKRGKTASFNAFDRLLRDGAKQADHIILEVNCDISPQALSDALNSRVLRSNIQEIRLRIGNAEAVYTRNEITRNGFKIKPEDFLKESAFRNEGARKNPISDAKVQEFIGLNKKSPQEIAIERHAKRDAAAIQQAWNERRIANIRQAVTDGLLPKESVKGLSELSQEELNTRLDFLQKLADKHTDQNSENYRGNTLARVLDDSTTIRDGILTHVWIGSNFARKSLWDIEKYHRRPMPRRGKGIRFAAVRRAS